MRYVRVLYHGVPRWGVYQDEGISLLQKAPYEEVVYDGQTVSPDQCRLLMPTEPTKIVCVGKNYYAHTVEMQEEVPQEPVIFLKAPNACNDPEGEIHAPAFVQDLHYEGELALVIKKRCKNIGPEEAPEYILGYTCLNDVTARDIQRKDGQWARGKSMDGFAPMGPWIVPLLDVSNRKIATRLNGKTVQCGSTSQMMYKIPEILSFISQSITLEPGDVVSTGTPAGVGPMQPGDVVEVEVEGIGTLRNTVV